MQVSLLDPVSYPGAIKAFAREVCRNDLLNFGRLHFFFPDSRLALDLNTDKTLKVQAPPFVYWPCSSLVVRLFVALPDAKLQLTGVKLKDGSSHSSFQTIGP